ncbi:subtilisin-like protease [Apiospora arundinis]
MQVPDANYDLWPVEINDAEFDAIRTATAAGILVFEPAANGAMDMDLPVVREGDASGSGGRALLNRKSPDFRDSGAIMVGASTSTLPRTRLVQSNYGSRVDVHAWGQNILTSTVDDSQQDIYANFSGTSGATPIVAGAALSIQGMLAAKGKAKLRPKEMRKLIAKGGSSTADPSKDRIGVQPDLRALIDGGYLK